MWWRCRSTAAAVRPRSPACGRAGPRSSRSPSTSGSCPPIASRPLRLAEAVIAGRVHAVTFTTGPAIRNWMAIAAEHDLDEPLRAALTGGRVVVGCVGPVCAEVAASRRAGERTPRHARRVAARSAGPGRRRPAPRAARRDRRRRHRGRAQRHRRLAGRRIGGAQRHRGPAAGDARRPAERRVRQVRPARRRSGATAAPTRTSSRSPWPVSAGASAIRDQPWSPSTAAATRCGSDRRTSAATARPAHPHGDRRGRRAACRERDDGCDESSERGHDEHAGQCTGVRPWRQGVSTAAVRG